MVLIVLAMLSTVLTTPSTAEERRRSDLEFHKWYVHIVNNLSQGKLLTAHCKSKDDDLGIHQIPVGDEQNWSFRQNFFETTLFWCSLAKDNVHADFDVFWDDDNFHYRCSFKDCIWVAKDDGIYLKNLPEGFDEYRHDWKQ
ncbi:hypothetical protein QUC31_015619 [Theobroma cacao]